MRHFSITLKQPTHMSETCCVQCETYRNGNATNCTCLSQSACLRNIDTSYFNSYPIKNYRGISPNYRGKRWAYVHLIRGSANHPINVHYEECKCAYLSILISEASTNKNYEEKMHREARKAIFLKLF